MKVPEIATTALQEYQEQIQRQQAAKAAVAGWREQGHQAMLDSRFEEAATYLVRARELDAHLGELSPKPASEPEARAAMIDVLRAEESEIVPTLPTPADLPTRCGQAIFRARRSTRGGPWQPVLAGDEIYAEEQVDAFTQRLGAWTQRARQWEGAPMTLPAWVPGVEPLLDELHALQGESKKVWRIVERARRVRYPAGITTPWAWQDSGWEWVEDEDEGGHWTRTAARPQPNFAPVAPPVPNAPLQRPEPQQPPKHAPSIQFVEGQRPSNFTLDIPNFPTGRPR